MEYLSVIQFGKKRVLLLVKARFRISLISLADSKPLYIPDFEQRWVLYCSANKDAFFLLWSALLLGSCSDSPNFVGGILFSVKALATLEFRHLDTGTSFCFTKCSKVDYGKRRASYEAWECVYVTPLLSFFFAERPPWKPRYRWVSVWKHDFLSPWKKNISNSDQPRFLSFLFFSSLSLFPLLPFFNITLQNART